MFQVAAGVDVEGAGALGFGSAVDAGSGDESAAVVATGVDDGLVFWALSVI